jgi:hypothetical protein
MTKPLADQQEAFWVNFVLMASDLFQCQTQPVLDSLFGQLVQQDRFHFFHGTDQVRCFVPPALERSFAFYS